MEEEVGGIEERSIHVTSSPRHISPQYETKLEPQCEVGHHHFSSLRQGLLTGVMSLCLLLSNATSDGI